MIHNLQLKIVLVLLACGVSGNAFVCASVQPLPSPQLNLAWQKQIEALSSVEPTLENQDRQVYQNIQRQLSNNTPHQAIERLESMPAIERSPVFDFMLAQLYLSQQEPLKAEVQLISALKKFENFQRAHRSLASLSLHLEKWDRAEHHASLAIGLGGNVNELYTVLAYAHYRQAQYASALNAYRHALIFNSRHWGIKTGLLYCLSQLGHHRELLALCEEMILEKPNDPIPWRLQSQAFIQESMTREAIINLDIIQAKGWADASTQRLLGQLYYNEGLFAEACDLFVASMPSSKDFEPYLQPLSQLVHANEMALAQRLSQGLRDHFDGDSLRNHRQWRFIEAQSLLKSNAIERGIEALETLVAEHPNHGLAMITLAHQLYLQKQMDLAIFYYERAAHLKDVEVHAWKALGQIHWERGELKKAIPWFENVLDREPSLALEETLLRLKSQL